MDTENWSVYIHTAPNGKVYVGITGRPPHERWANGYNYRFNKEFYSDIKKYGWNNIMHEVVFSDLSKELAQSKEKELIAYYNATSDEHGYNKLVGKAGIGSRNNFFGKTHSDEFKKRQSERMKGSEHHKTPVAQIDSTGAVVATFPSAKSASNTTGIKYRAIIHCCSGETKQAGGYLWRRIKNTNLGG